MRKDEVVAMLATLEANQVNIQEALKAHQDFTSTKFDEIAEVLKRIEIQTIKTNGRTAENEKDIATLKKELKPILDWKAKLGGVWFTIGIIGGILGVFSGIIIGILTLLK